MPDGYELVRNADRTPLGERDSLEEAIDLAKDEARGVDGDVVIYDPDGKIVARVYYDGMVETYDEFDSLDAPAETASTDPAEEDEDRGDDADDGR